jgi:carboxymethylenebutenolidase
LVIDRSPTDVFDFVADERNRYDPRILNSEKLTVGPIGLGTRFRSEMASLGRTVSMTVAITAYDRPHLVATTSRLTGMAIHSTLRFEPSGTRTRLHWQSQVEPVGAMNVLSPVLGILGRQQMAPIWTGLKRTLERKGDHVSLGDVPCYLTVPAGEGRWPGVVVLHDALGMTTDLRNQADWLAANGYLAAAPDLYHRGSRIRCMVQTMRAFSAGHGDAFDDIDAVRGALANRDDCSGRVGIVGFCMGGGFAMALAPTSGYAAASVNYGTARERELSRLGDVCPIVASYGGRDRSLRGAAANLERLLTEHGIDHDVKEYPDAGHGFLNDHAAGETPLWAAVAGRYAVTADHQPTAPDARNRILDFFARHLED